MPAVCRWRAGCNGGVESVRRFLTEKGEELSRVQVIGSTPEEKKRRVTVTLMTDPD